MNNVLNTINDSTIKRLVRDYGSPLYLFDEQGFRDNLLHLRAAFRAVYEKYNVAYSFKTNYTPYICNIIKEEGGIAEVVSDMEFYLAMKLGFKYSKIIYNGPCKGDRLNNFLLNGGLSNIDNVDEAERVVEWAKANPKIIINVGVRLNLDIDAGYVSRFGIEYDSEDLRYVFGLLKQVSNIHVKGLHIHISRARGIEAWAKRIGLMLECADKYFDEAPDYIDVGSGMFAEMDDSLADQFSCHIPTYEEYAEIVGGVMAKHYANSTKKPQLLSEPGTTVIARYMSLITRVNNIKEVRGHCFATVDSSYYNTGEIVKMKQLLYRIIKGENNGKASIAGKTDVMGFTCLEQDKIFIGFPKKLHVGDLIVFGNVGGYSIVSKPPFIHPNCRMLAFNNDSEYKEIMREQTFEDIYQTFVY